MVFFNENIRILKPTTQTKDIQFSISYYLHANVRSVYAINIKNNWSYLQILRRQYFVNICV